MIGATSLVCPRPRVLLRLILKKDRYSSLIWFLARERSQEKGFRRLPMDLRGQEGHKGTAHAEGRPQRTKSKGGTREMGSSEDLSGNEYRPLIRRRRGVDVGGERTG